MQAFKKFVIRELVFTISIAILAFILFQSVLKNYYLPVFWILLGVISILTGILHYSVVQVSEKNVSKFSSRFMMVTGIKMIIYLVFITGYVFSNTQNASTFLIQFFILYIIYTLLEVISIVKYFRSNK